MKIFDLFSGCGGFRLGFERAGFQCVGFCEMDKHAVKFYKQAYSTKNEAYFNDATKITTRELPDFNVLCAGFPCQAFSIVGKRRGFDDTRGTLFFDIVRILKDKRPRYFILENVKNLLNHDDRQTLITIVKSLADLGYNVESALLNSQYFGIPQNRERVFIVGYLGKKCCGKILPLKEKINLNDRGAQESQEKRERVFAAVATKPDRIEGNYVLDEKGIRRLTPLECFRLQGFPDEIFYKGSQGISGAQLYKMAGNSVTVNVIYEIAKRIKESDARSAEREEVKNAG